MYWEGVGNMYMGKFVKKKKKKYIVEKLWKKMMKTMAGKK